MAKPEIKAEAIRLRLEERLSIDDIRERTGASQGGISVWLRPYPLTEAEVHARKSGGDKRRSTPSKSRGEQSKFYGMVDVAALSRQDKAKIAEAAVLFRLVIHRYVTFGSVFDGDKADWLVEIPQQSRIVKVQVRWVKLNSTGLPVVSLCCSDGRKKVRRFAVGEFDFVVGYDFFADTAYVFSADEVSHLKTAVATCPEAAERWDKFLTV